MSDRHGRQWPWVQSGCKLPILAVLRTLIWCLCHQSFDIALVDHAYESAFLLLSERLMLSEAAAVPKNARSAR